MYILNLQLLIRLFLVSLFFGFLGPVNAIAQENNCNEILKGWKSSKTPLDEKRAQSPSLWAQLNGDIKYTFDPQKFSVKLTRVSAFGQRVQFYRNQFFNFNNRFKDSILGQAMTYLEPFFRTSRVPLPNSMRSPFMMYSSKFVNKLVEASVWILNPTPFHFSLFNRKTVAIYEKIKVNPDLELSKILSNEEIDYLIERDLFEDAEIFQQTMRNRSNIQKAMQNVSIWSRQGIVNGPLVAAFLSMAVLVPNGSFVSQEEYIKDRLSEADPKVELILDTALYSHTAIRIGGKVYSPSKTSITVLHAENYFSNLERNPIREVQTIQINLSPEVVAAVQKDLDSMAWKNYENITFFYDCTTVISDVLKRQANLVIPPVVNASPALTMSFLKMKGLYGYGNSKIGPSTFIYRATSQGRTQALMRVVPGAIEHSIESKIFMLAHSFIQERQAEIRLESSLIYESEDSKKAFRGMVEAERRNLENDREFARNLNIIRLLEIKVKRNPNSKESSENLKAAQVAFLDSLQDLILSNQELYSRETDSALRIQISAKIVAVEEIKNRIQNEMDADKSF